MQTDILTHISRSVAVIENNSNRIGGSNSANNISPKMESVMWTTAAVAANVLAAISSICYNYPHAIISIIHKVLDTMRTNTCSFEQQTHALRTIFIFTLIWDLFYTKNKQAYTAAVLYALCVEQKNNNSEIKRNGKYLENKTVFISWEKEWIL